LRAYGSNGALPFGTVQGNLRPASDVEITRLLGHPNEITRFLFGAEAAQRERLELDRAWHAIHFALNGSRLGGDAPLNFLASEGTPVGDVDVGYGPARVLTSEQVRQLAQAVATIEPDHFGARLDTSALDANSIYPGGWGRNGQSVGTVAEAYRDMRALILRLSEGGLGLILYIN
jgi:Domain of unknown function (DUF1877)